MGFRGAGKSLYAVSLACALSKRFNLPILANIRVNYPGAERMESIEQFADATKRVCLFDEAHRNLDSRMWADNKGLTDVLLYNRKRVKHVIYTTPHVRNIDVRIRDIVPMLIVVIRPPGTDKIVASWFDVEKSGGIDQLGKPFKTDVVNDRRVFYRLYNTWEEAPILPATLDGHKLTGRPRAAASSVPVVSSAGAAVALRSPSRSSLVPPDMAGR